MLTQMLTFFRVCLLVLKIKRAIRSGDYPDMIALLQRSEEFRREEDLSRGQRLRISNLEEQLQDRADELWSSFLVKV